MRDATSLQFYRSTIPATTMAPSGTNGLKLFWSRILTLMFSRNRYERLLVAKFQWGCKSLIWQAVGLQTIYPDDNICQKCGRKSGLWVLHETVNKTNAENMKKIVGAVCELPAKQHSQSSPFPLKFGWIGCAI